MGLSLRIPLHGRAGRSHGLARGASFFYARGQICTAARSDLRHLLKTCSWCCDSLSTNGRSPMVSASPLFAPSLSQDGS